MNKYHVKVIVRILEIYEVEAEDEDAAEDSWADGKLIETDDGVLENEVLSVEEA